jgi:hypothetical protein
LRKCTFIAVEQREHLILFERQKTGLFDAYIAAALPVEDLKLRRVQLATEIERTGLGRRLSVLLAHLQKARKTPPDRFASVSHQHSHGGGK